MLRRGVAWRRGLEQLLDSFRAEPDGLIRVPVAREAGGVVARRAFKAHNFAVFGQQPPFGAADVVDDAKAEAQQEQSRRQPRLVGVNGPATPGDGLVVVLDGRVESLGRQVLDDWL
jgi:hypothetical protein